MRLPLATGNSANPQARRRHTGAASAFTLAEVLAAMLFLVIVVPVVVEAMHIASLSGEVAARKSEAALVAERVLNETVVMTNWTQGGLSGSVMQGGQEYRWSINNQTWNTDSTMELLAIEVGYSAGGREYSVKMSTLAPLQTSTTMGGTQ